MVLGLVVLGAILNVLVSQNRTNAVQQEVAYAQQNVRAAMDLMVHEIRNAGHDPANGGFDAIGTATSTTIQVRADYSDPDADGYAEGDGDASDPNEDVTYAVNASNQLTRNGTRIVDFVDHLQFGYVLEDDTMLDPPGAPLTTAQMRDVRAVIVRLGVRTENRDPDTGQYRFRNLVTGVRIRNMGFQDIE
jgi:Tfp pilus assembly protein PilW